MAAQPTPAHPAVMEAQVSEQPTTTTITADSPLPPPILTTARLQIRPMHPQDAHTKQAAASPPSITRYMSLAFAYPYTLQHAETWISLNLSSPPNNFVITPLDAPTTCIGGIGHKPGSDVHSHAAEVGYWIGEDWQGKGMMSEALEAFTAWAFEGRGGRGELRRLWAGVFEGNAGSMKCLERCGYRKEGVMKGHAEKKGEVWDMHIFGLTKSDWEEWRSKEEK